MSFGSDLRRLRDARGWSRQRLSEQMNGLLSAAAVKALEMDTEREPQNGTRANLIKLFPELDTTNQKLEPKGYLSPAFPAHSMAARTW